MMKASNRSSPCLVEIIGIDQMSEHETEPQPADDVAMAGFDGATFELRLFMATHSTVCFRLTGLSAGYVDLCFHSTWLVDCPTTMHGVTVRIADDIEAERARELVSDEVARDLQRLVLYRLNSDEGKYYIWAEAASFGWNGKLVVWMKDQGVDDVIRMSLRRPLH